MTDQSLKTWSIIFIVIAIVLIVWGACYINVACGSNEAEDTICGTPIVTAGNWMVAIGIIFLIVGIVMYFGSKRDMKAVAAGTNPLGDAIANTGNV